MSGAMKRAEETGSHDSQERALLDMAAPHRRGHQQVDGGGACAEKACNECTTVLHYRPSHTVMLDSLSQYNTTHNSWHHWQFCAPPQHLSARPDTARRWQALSGPRPACAAARTPSRARLTPPREHPAGTTTWHHQARNRQTANLTSPGCAKYAREHFHTITGLRFSRVPLAVLKFKASRLTS